MCRSPRPVRQPPARQGHEAAPSAGLRRQSDAKPLTQRGKGELPSGTTARLREERAARPHHVAPRAGPHASAPGALCSLETPGAGRPQGVPAPCRGLGETRRTGRQPPQTPRQPPPPRPRARCAPTRGERGQPPGAGAECGEGATWLEAAGPSPTQLPFANHKSRLAWHRLQGTANPKLFKSGQKCAQNQGTAAYFQHGVEQLQEGPAVGQRAPPVPFLTG